MVQMATVAAVTVLLTLFCLLSLGTTTSNLCCKAFRTRSCGPCLHVACSPQSLLASITGKSKRLLGVRWGLWVCYMHKSVSVYSVYVQANSPQQKCRMNTGCADEGTALLYNNAVLRQIQTVVRPNAAFTGCKAAAQTIRQASTQVSWQTRPFSIQQSPVCISGLN